MTRNCKPFSSFYLLTKNYYSWTIHSFSCSSLKFCSKGWKNLLSLRRFLKISRTRVLAFLPLALTQSWGIRLRAFWEKALWLSCIWPASSFAAWWLSVLLPKKVQKSLNYSRKTESVIRLYIQLKAQIMSSFSYLSIDAAAKRPITQSTEKIQI